jgi:PQQ-like domain
MLLAGCSSSNSGKGSGPSGPPGSAGRSSPAGSGSSSSSGKLTQTFDPPLVFDKQPVAVLPASVLGNVTDGANTYNASILDGTVVYAVTDSAVAAVDVETGQEKWHVQVDGTGANSSGAAPLLADGKVYAAFKTTIPGKGTTPEQPAITVVAVDVASGTKTLTMQVPTPDADPVGAMAVAGPTKVYAVSGNQIAVGRGAGAFVLDATTKTIAWQRKDFVIREVADGVVIGVNTKPVPDNGSDEVLGLRLTDGRPAWQLPDREPGITVGPAAPHLVVVNTPKAVLFLSTADGKMRSQLSQPASSISLAATWCAYDERSMTICKGAGRMVGLDPNAPGKPKWQIIDGSARKVPEVTAVYHGAIYGSTDNGPVVLDAATGADKPDAPQLAPQLVNDHVGIGKPDARPIGAYRPIK